MADDLLNSLQTYKVQLDQVEAALTSDPYNAELKKLKADLEEIITLSANLIDIKPESSKNYDDTASCSKQWQVGDKCVAKWSKDGQWYDAVIDAITDDGMAAITFDEYRGTDVSQVAHLKERSSPFARGFSSNSKEEKLRRKQMEIQRQQSKKRKQKKHDRQKMIEEAHEADKAKWQTFASKTKKLKGITKKSIFATPDAATGRVGIGTCNQGGKPMTDFQHAEKWRKGL